MQSTLFYLLPLFFSSELFDTFFIVIHKKKLIFLHWYHHITVLLYCWHSYVTRSPPGIFFVTMNYAVHASMYFYYFLVATRTKPKWFHPMVITALQISQMIVGVFVTLASFYQFRRDERVAGPCHIPQQNITAGFIMYGSYLFLFLQFFVRRYWKIHIQKQHHHEPKLDTADTNGHDAATNGHSNNANKDKKDI
jgi:elongation of very long chain fatty acids protein 6